MKTQASKPEDCIVALKPLATGRLRDFGGLVANCSFAELTAEWPPLDDWQGVGFLGRRQRSRHFQYLPLGGLSMAARVWFAEDEVTLIDVEDPAIDWAEILALGEPAARLDTSWLGTRIPEGEWVYPQRGLSLHIRPSAEKCFHLVAFTPTTLPEFVAESQLIFDLTLRPELLEEE